ncbi:DUF4363 family protein [Thermosyntropha sp.]|uniref:DUF4363 family protein n=1 Tax=Thermosyntropha sp. TaxID=2740820 RepID=UPI0025E4CB4A|nr:DUF4363 family protein [Thermosyntropha sp.]MBO8159253.1 DUF4363 family protein [Thermosyntropha sp.]
MGKIIYYTSIIIILSLFVFILNSGDIAKKPWNREDDFEFYAESLHKNLKSENWIEAKKDLISLKKAWKKTVKRIQYSVEKDEINAINVNLARLTGYIENKDKSAGLAEIHEIQEHWHNLNN